MTDGIILFALILHGVLSWRRESVMLEMFIRTDALMREFITRAFVKQSAEMADTERRAHDDRERFSYNSAHVDPKWSFGEDHIEK